MGKALFFTFAYFPSLTLNFLERPVQSYEHDNYFLLKRSSLSSRLDPLVSGFDIRATFKRPIDCRRPSLQVHRDLDWVEWA